MKLFETIALRLLGVPLASAPGKPEPEPEPEEKPKPPLQPFDPKHRLLPSRYIAVPIISAEIYHGRSGRYTVCKATIQVESLDNGTDTVTAIVYITAYTFARLCDGLAIPRTNDVRAILNRRVNIEVREIARPEGLGIEVEIIGPFLRP